MYVLTKEQLLRDLHRAFLDARRHKKGKSYVKGFERRLEKNLAELGDDLWCRRYVPLPAICFPISDPTKREIIAAQFRDCIVNHLYFNYTHEMYERTFIYDSYSCIKGRGTRMGVRRAEHHMRSATKNHTRPAYVLQKDIRGFFIHINRKLVMRIALDSVGRMAAHRISKDSGTTWGDIRDVGFINYLTETICLHDPTVGCIVKGSASEWRGLPDSKSMRKAGKGYGLALGNLNSQLLCNVLMNVFDQFVKRGLKCRWYGRSTDDFYVIEPSIKRIRKINRKIIAFLGDMLDLITNEGKTRIIPCARGFRFLGAFIKPWRTYMAKQTVLRIRTGLSRIIGGRPEEERLRNSVNSFLGMMKHFRSFRLRLALLVPYISEWKFNGTFNADYTIYRPAAI